MRTTYTCNLDVPVGIDDEECVEFMACSLDGEMPNVITFEEWLYDTVTAVKIEKWLQEHYQTVLDLIINQWKNN